MKTRTGCVAETKELVPIRIHDLSSVATDGDHGRTRTATKADLLERTPERGRRGINPDQGGGAEAGNDCQGLLLDLVIGLAVLVSSMPTLNTVRATRTKRKLLAASSTGEIRSQSVGSKTFMPR